MSLTAAKLKNYNDAQLTNVIVSNPPIRKIQAETRTQDQATLFPTNSLCLMVDVALNQNMMKTGLGAVIKQSPHCIAAAHSTSKLGASTPLFAEAQALFEGLQFTQKKNFVIRKEGSLKPHRSLSLPSWMVFSIKRSEALVSSELRSDR
ncbi:hypothetical protein G4B88_018010 [Cannabis sativa]|uniref:RNase H type-1 domain-containing protein n=1 Tax=Cannabis sativa TaxID=3483 RepID=A0A7J6HKX1_CANSA|nr:hypothetical protein G4B88_018010 [Cannabis sativa]